VTVAEVTTTIRGLDAEVVLGTDDGMPRRCVANLDRIVTIGRSILDRHITSLGRERMAEVERAIHLALGMPLPCQVS
jgi:mRNA interferase MazF